MNQTAIHVLLVEDNLAESRFLQELLKDALFGRFKLSHTKRLREAITLLEASAPDIAPDITPDTFAPKPLEATTATSFDVILLDLSLPDSTGLDSLDAILQTAPHLPIVVLTNTNNDQLAVDAVRHGAQDYLMKRQIDQESLVRSLHYAIERKQNAEALREANESLELRVQQRTAELATANERLQREVEKRQKIQERLELAQQAAQIGTFEWNLQSGELSWTTELEALYDMAPGSFSGQVSDWLQTLHPDDRAGVEQALQQSLDTRQGLTCEFRMIRCAAGQPSANRWIAVKSSLFQDAVGTPLRMIGIHMDITEKKQLEAQFLRAQRLESLGTLASGIAHDLNNIMTPVLAVAQILPLKLPHLDPQSQNMLSILETSARRGTEIIRQILSFARGVEGKRVCLQVNYLLAEVREILRQTLPKSIEISTEFAPDLWTVFGDATQLHQVLMNLCVNARDAMPHGGSLDIKTENRVMNPQDARLHLEANDGNYVVVTIKDNGMGIPHEILHRIFDPFFTTKEIGKGTGLGLSAVLGIIKSHGGFVDVQSEVNQGSRFRIYLPASQAPVPPVVDDLERLTGHQELILVIDDEALICESMQATLERYNYRVLTTTSSVEALTLFAEHQTQIYRVIIDTMMPSMDGFATLSILRRFDPNLYAIAMSGLSSAETIAQAKKHNFQDFLPKPFTVKQLLQSVYPELQGEPGRIRV